MNNLEIAQSERAMNIKFTSSFENVNKAVDNIMHFAESKDYRGNHFNLNLVLRETLNNAVEHGNKNNPELLVYGDFEVADKSILVNIKDQGSGFNWTEFNNNQKDTCEAGGRGILLCKRLGFKVEFNKKGNIIRLRNEHE